MISARSRMIRADSPHCACRLGATKCMQLRAGIASLSASVAASQAPGLHAQLICKRCDEDAACGLRLSGFLGL